MKGQVLLSDASWLKVTMYHQWFWKKFLEKKEAGLIKRAKRDIADGLHVNTRRDGWEHITIRIFELETKYVIMLEAMWAYLTVVAEVEKQKVKYAVKKLMKLLEGTVFDDELVWFHLAYRIQHFDRDAFDIHSFLKVLKEAYGWEVEI